MTPGTAASAGSLRLLRSKVIDASSANQRSPDGRSIVQLAALHAHEECVDFLLEKGAETKGLLSFAAAGGAHGTFEKLLRRTTGSELDDAIKCAVHADNTTATKALLEHGADLYTLDKEKECLLFLAKSPKMVRILLESGADTNSIKYFESRLEQMNPEIALILSESAKRHELPDPDGNLASLWRALRKSKRTNVMELARSGISLDSLEPKTGQTVLCFTLSCAMPDILPDLIECGADPNGRSSNSWTALHFAHAYEQYEAVEQLQARGASASVVDRDGNTPEDVSGAP